MDDHDKVLQIIHLKEQAPIHFDFTKGALVIIDVQRYFTGPDYPFGRVFEQLVPGSVDAYFERVNRTVVPSIQRLLSAFRAQELPVIYTATGTRLCEGHDLPLWLRNFDNLGMAVL